MDSVTQLLLRWRSGDEGALDQLMPLVYAELRRLASAHFRNERPEHTLQPTALVNEAYLKLISLEQPDWECRAQFMAAASRMMRQVLVDYSRRKRAEKRGSGGRMVVMNEDIHGTGGKPYSILALDDALAALARLDPGKCRMIELRFFGGLTASEIAHVMGISTATLTRNLRTAEAWLARELKAEE